MKHLWQCNERMARAVNTAAPLPPVALAWGPQNGWDTSFGCLKLSVPGAAWQETVVAYRRAIFSYRKVLFLCFECFQIPLF